MSKLTYEDLLLLREGLDCLLADYWKPASDLNRDDGKFRGEDLLIVLQGRKASKQSSQAFKQRLRTHIWERKVRSKFFDQNLFADPCWEVLLDLALAEAEGKPVVIKSACIASGVPPSTALRRINVLVEAGLVDRKPDLLDNRRVLVGLTESGQRAMEKYFHLIDQMPIATDPK